MSNIVQKAIDYAVGIAKDDKHGYSQGNTRWGNPDYDCSALVITAWEQAGVKVKTAGATYTGNMKSVFLKCGFEDITKSITLSTGSGLIPGDILLKEGSHTAMFIGNKQIVHASINELGKITGGKSGDQTGKEIRVRSYYNYPWNCILRYPDEVTVKEFQKAFGLEVDGIVGPITKAKMGAVLKLINKYVKG
jgi:cell wall-associated NlpC family hydrolase